MPSRAALPYNPDMAESSRPPLRLGCVSFVNTLPLIDGLERLADFELIPTVPASLIGMLEADQIDLGLISTVDYQRSSMPLALVPAGMIGCDGPTFTVRLYSKVPISQVSQVHVDTDSHASVTLLQILLREMHSLAPEITQYDAREHVAEDEIVEWPTTLLLIGDKVVTSSPPAVRYPYQLDLGEAWHAMTELPFVYAMWMCRGDLEGAQRQRIKSAAAVLDRQRRHNLERVEQFVGSVAVKRGWPADLATLYLTRMLRFAVGEREKRALELFFDLAHKHKLIPRRKPTVWLE
jgi:chorismate dehydratase